jgi:hypothetical protein
MHQKVGERSLGIDALRIALERALVGAQSALEVLEGSSTESPELVEHEGCARGILLPHLGARLFEDRRGFAPLAQGPEQARGREGVIDAAGVRVGGLAKRDRCSAPFTASLQAAALHGRELGSCRVVFYIGDRLAQGLQQRFVPSLVVLLVGE